jgi:SAM-dependent methyltransferase
MFGVQPFTVPIHNAHYEGMFSEVEYRWVAANAHCKIENIINLLGPNLANVKSALEVGCGTGIVLNMLGELYPSINFTGVDVEDPHIHTVPGKAKNVTFLKYDGDCLPFDRHHFDFVFATHVLEHVPNQRPFIAEIKRVSRGLIYFEVPCELHVRASASAIQSTLNIGHINFYTPDSFLVTLQTSGLKIVKADLFDVSPEVYRLKTTPLKAAIGFLIRRLSLRISKRAASKVFCYHCGALCTAE